MPYLSLMTIELAAHLARKCDFIGPKVCLFSYDRILTTAVLIGHLIWSLDTEETIKLIQGIFITIN